jgi:hypothetical protein
VPPPSGRSKADLLLGSSDRARWPAIGTALFSARHGRGQQRCHDTCNSCHALSKTSHHYLPTQTVRPGVGSASALATGDILADPASRLVPFITGPSIESVVPSSPVTRCMRCPPPHLAACSEPVSVRRPAAVSARDSSTFSSTDWLIVCSYVGEASGGDHPRPRGSPSIGLVSATAY